MDIKLRLNPEKDKDGGEHVLSQYEVGRVIDFYIYDGDDLYEIPDGAAVYFSAKKADKNIYVTPIDNQGSYAELTVEEQLSAVSGAALAELIIVSGDTDIRTENFTIYFEKAPVKNGLISESLIDIENLEEVEF